MRIRTRHLAVGLTCVVAMATFAGPGWAVRPNDEAGMLGVGAIAAGTEQESIRPDDRGTARGPGSLVSTSRIGGAVRPDDRAEARGPGAVVATPTILSAPTADEDGFPWAEVSTGATLFLLLGLVGSALVLNGRFHRRPA
jgi:hypothetical protein